MSADPNVSYLKMLSLFREVPDETLAFLCSAFVAHKLQKGETLIVEGEPAHSLFLIRSGWVKVVTTDPEGRELILNQIGPGQIIGEVSLIDGGVRSGRVIAISAMQAWEFTYEHFLAALEQSPELNRAFLASMFERLRFANLYLEQVIAWSQAIAAGDYATVQNQIQTTQATIVDLSHSSEIRIGAFLSAFFRMVDQVMKREEDLKRKLQRFEISVDEEQKQKAVQDVASNSFFLRVKSAAREMRQRRQDSENKE